MEIPQPPLDKLVSALIALGDQAPTLLTKIGLLRAIFVEIESAKKYGYSYGVILETLIANGLKATTPNQFYGLINRIRLERGIAPAQPVLLDRSRRSGDKEKSENNTIEQLNQKTQPNEEITGTGRVSQEELKATMRATVDPNEFLE